jgi:hypothetical protein
MLCAAHCALMPLLATASVGAHSQAGQGLWLEVLLVGVAAVVGYATLLPAYRRHRRPVPLVLLTGGLLALVGSHTFVPHDFGTLSTLAGALAVCAGQLLNRRLPGSCCT